MDNDLRKKETFEETYYEGVLEFPQPGNRGADG